MTKYLPLQKHLESRPGTETEASLSFAHIEGIIGDSLPASSGKYREWWANESTGSHVQAKAWLGAGWIVESVNLRGQTVIFARRRRRSAAD
jgi:hypothetical protein